MHIAQGLLSEDDFLLTEILFNPYTSEQVEQIRKKLRELLDIIGDKDSEQMKLFLTEVRENIR
jgi:prephenate dehydrogenase